jgi:hypothetical protein
MEDVHRAGGIPAILQGTDVNVSKAPTTARIA